MTQGASGASHLRFRARTVGPKGTAGARCGVDEGRHVYTSRLARGLFIDFTVSLRFQRSTIDPTTHFFDHSPFELSIISNSIPSPSNFLSGKDNTCLDGISAPFQCDTLPRFTSVLASQLPDFYLTRLQTRVANPSPLQIPPNMSKNLKAVHFGGGNIGRGTDRVTT